MREPTRGGDVPRQNPFRYGDVATGEHFTDRDAELAALQTDIRSGQNVVVLSPRRYGKTSLITEAIARLRREGVLVAYVDLLRATTKERFASQLATALYDALVPSVERVLQRAGEFFLRLPIRPKLTINQDGTPSFEFGAAANDGDLDTVVDRLLELPAAAAAQRKRRGVLVLDEFQEVVAIDPHLPARMRSTFQFQVEVAHVYLGSRQHLLRRVFTDANAPLYNSAKVLPLGPIPAEDFAPFIAQRFAASGAQVTDDAVARLLEITQGHPHDTQKLCYFTWALADAEEQPATRETVERALEELLVTDTARYAELWDALTLNQRRMLEAVARDDAGGSPLAEDFRKRYRLGPYASAERALDALVDRGLVERVARDAVAMPDVFLRLWLIRDPSAPDAST
jgi:hypothetical protein